MTEPSPAVIHECGACGHVMQVPGRYAGTEQRCRRCGAAFRVASADPDEPGEDSGTTALPIRSRRSLVVAGVVALVVLPLALVLLGTVALGPPSASNLVRRTLSPTVMPFKWSQAPLAGGTAVVLNDTAAYWVRDGVVYACDANARAWSPEIASAPPEIDLLAVQRAVMDRPPSATR